MDIKLLTQVEKQSIGDRQPIPEAYLRLSDDEMDTRIAAEAVWKVPTLRWRLRRGGAVAG